MIILRRIILSLFILLPSILFSQELLSQVQETQITLSEVWIIDDTEYVILGTSIIDYSLYTVHVEIYCQGKSDKELINEAKKIAGYANSNGYLKNSIKYNNYNKNIKIIESGIGIIVHPAKEEENQLKRNLMFPITQLDDFYSPENNIALLSNSVKIKLSELNKKLQLNVSKGNFKKLIDLFDKTIIENTGKEKIQNAIDYEWGKAKKVFFNNNEFIVYVENKDGSRIYTEYFPISIDPKSAPGTMLKAFITVRFVVINDSIAIQSININFSDANNYSVFMK